MSIVEVFSGKDPKPVGMRIGPVVRGYRIEGRDPASGSFPDGPAAEARQLMLNLQQNVESCGGTLANVAQVSLRFANVARDLQHLNDVWKEFFPDADDRPTYKFMADLLVGGARMEAEYFAVLLEKRRSIHIPPVAHTNPIPMACLMGDYLFSSRILPLDPATGKEADCVEDQWDHVLLNTGAVLENAGMDWSDITQGRLFIQDPSLAPSLHGIWSDRFVGKISPPLHIQPYVGAPTLKVMLEIIACRKTHP